LKEAGCSEIDSAGLGDDCKFFEVPTTKDHNQMGLFSDGSINGSVIPEFPVLGNMRDIIDTTPEEKFFISPVGCKGILRRSKERGIKINARLELFLTRISSTMSDEEIEKRSRIQKRGSYSA